MHLLGQGIGVVVVEDEEVTAFEEFAVPWEDGAVPKAPELSPLSCGLVHLAAHPTSPWLELTHPGQTPVCSGPTAPFTVCLSWEVVAAALQVLRPQT